MVQQLVFVMYLMLLLYHLFQIRSQLSLSV